MKGKLDADKLKELCLNNFEKVVFGILVLFFLMMALSAMKVKPYAKKPEQLSSELSRARTRMEQVQQPEPVTRSYDSLVIGIQEELPETEYATAVSWNPILSKESQKRRTPHALTVKNLAVKEWHGSVQRPQKLQTEANAEPDDFDDGLGGRSQKTTEGVRCCILIGEIPLAEQEQEHQKKLGLPPMDQQRLLTRSGVNGMMENGVDSPIYFNYSVERAVVPSDGDMTKIAEKDWVELHKKSSPNEQRILYFNGDSAAGGGFRSSGMDIPEKYRPPELYRFVKPDPKKADDKNAKTTTRRNQMNAGMGDMSGALANGLVPARDATLMVPLPQVAQSSNNVQFNWSTYLPYSDEFELELVSFDGRRIRRASADDAKGTGADADEESSEGDDDEFDDDEYETADPTLQENTLEQEDAKVRLFRYVDYTVEPGKQYVYRVKLMMHNPNYQYEPAWNVEDSAQEDRKKRYLESAWSEISEPVTIPLDQHFYLPGFMKRYSKMDRKTIMNEKKWAPYLNLMPVTFNESDGNEDFTYFSEIMLPAVKSAKKSKKKFEKAEEPYRIKPGQLLNLTVYEDSIRQLGNMDQGMGDYGNRRAKDDEEEDRAKESFRTGFILLDVRGGKELYEPLTDKDFKDAQQPLKDYPGGIYSPAMALLLGPKGDFIIQSELEDVDDVYRRREKVEPYEMVEETASAMDEGGSRSRKNRKRNEANDMWNNSGKQGRR